jgi:hypothetical protein
VISKQNNVQVFRITAARQGLHEDVRGRQRRYVIAMSVRTVSVILAATLWNVARPVALVALVLGIGLPYIAVVIANGGREQAPAPQASFIPAASRLVIAPPRHEGSAASAPEDMATGAGTTLRPEPNEAN